MSANSPKVSIILAVYNGAQQVGAAVESILNQTYANFELIISDDASSDRTMEVVEVFAADPRVRILRQARNLGFVGNKNAAFSVATGELLTQQDHDDISHPDRLHRQVGAMLATGASVCACGVERIRSNGSVGGFFATDREIELRELPNPLPFFFPPTMWKREVWEAYGPFHEFFSTSFGEDRFFLSKVMRRHSVLVIPDILYTYNDTPGSVTSVVRSDRALVMEDMLDHLCLQNAERGTNDLDQGEWKALAELERSLLMNSHLMGDRLRTYAARAIDHNEMRNGLKLIIRSVLRKPLSRDLLRTIIYLARKSFARAR